MTNRDDPRQISFLDAAPADERKDAHNQLIKSYTPLSQITNMEKIQPVVDFIEDQYIDGQMLKGNAIRVPGRKKKDSGMQSVRLDEFQIFAYGNFFEKQSGITFDQLRVMVDQTPILGSIVLTRLRQVSRYTRPSEKDDAPGFQITHRDRDHQVTDDERRSISELERFFANCGWEFDPRKRQRMKRDNFSHFISKMVRDSLIMDSAPIETEMRMNSSNGIDGFYSVDGSTIRLCSERGYEGDDEIFSVQVVQGQIRTAYTYNDLIYVPRNPRADVRLAGYGMGEPELLVKVVTGILNAMNLNLKGFSENSIPRGILQLVGEFDQNDLTAFKRYWNSMVKGVNNAWSLPVMVSKDAESKASFENINADFDEMYFSKWMTFLTSIACAIYGMGPDEINFEAFSAQTSSLSGSDTAEKLADSKDKGLRPLLAWIEDLMTDYICASFSDKYVFRFTGLDTRDQEKSHELRKMTATINEIRADLGDEKIEESWGEAPANPVLVQVWQAENQEEDYGEEAGGFAQPGEGGDQDEEEIDSPEDLHDREGDFGERSANSVEELQDKESGLNKSMSVYRVGV